MLQNLPACDSSPRGGVAGFSREAACFQRKYFVAVEMHGYEPICRQSPKEAIVKTGNTANHQGLYSSEWCDFDVTFDVITGDINQVNEHSGPFQVFQELVSKTESLSGAFD